MRSTNTLIAVALFCVITAPNGSLGRGFGGGHGGGGGFHGGGSLGGAGFGGYGGFGGARGGFEGTGFGGQGRGADFDRGFGGAGYGTIGRGEGFNTPGGGFGDERALGAGRFDNEFGAELNSGPVDFGGGNFAGRSGLGASGLSRFGAGPSRGQLNSFLGLPTDAGMHEANGAFGARAIPGGGFSNPAARNAVANRGFNHPALSGYASNTFRHSQALNAHRWYDGNRVFSPSWTANHPWAWHPGRYSADVWARRAWRYATWPAVGVWLGWGDVPYVNYDYGDTIVYEGDNVYQNGQVVATAPEYYEQASELAGQGSGSDASGQSNADWLPLGVYGLMKSDQKTPQMMFQLAVDKQGDLRGNYYNTEDGKMEPVSGSINKSTQRAAWTVGNNNVVVVETGLYNLTQDQSTALVHLNSQKAEIYTLVRMKQPADASPDSDSATSN